jgi:hypothetical protein
MTAISFADTVMGLHSQWFRNTGIGFQTSQINTQYSAEYSSGCKMQDHS